MNVPLLNDKAAGVAEGVERFLASLRLEDGTGSFLPCANGATDAGRRIRLGFSCLALKTYYMLGTWQKLSQAQRREWLELIKSFQSDKKDDSHSGLQNAFVDPHHRSEMASKVSWLSRIKQTLAPRQLSDIDKIALAETKQAIATLAQAGESPSHVFRSFPSSREDLRRFMGQLDWTVPWSAGGTASTIAALLRTQAPLFLESELTKELTAELSGCFEHLSHPENGGYYSGKSPSHGQLVNGAMKVLTALDWLDVPVHYPKALIDSCLSRLPEAEGCHTVDWVYVVYRASKQTDHRHRDIREGCCKVLSMLQRHRNADGGFSSRIGQAKSHYYGVRVSNGLPESDIHGTCLMVWAFSMIMEILGGSWRWNPIKP